MQQALSASNIKYLLALRSLCGPSNEIRCVSVADALGISKASVHAMMNALKEKNLIEKNHYGMVHFTPEGRSLADQYAACYDVLAGYLHRVSSEEAAPARRAVRFPCGAAAGPSWPSVPVVRLRGTLLRLGTPAEVRPRWNMLLLAGLLPDAPEAFSSARRLEMTNHEIHGCPQENGAS